MGTRLKRKVKRYFSHIWVFEICIIIGVASFFGVEVFKDIFTPYNSSALSSMEATFNPQEYYKQTFLDEVKGLQRYIYNNTNGLEDILSKDIDKEEILKSYFINDSYEGQSHKLSFVIKDKRDGTIITNDFNQNLTESNLSQYIESKKSKENYLKEYENESVSEEGLQYDGKVLSNFQEYYYSDVNRYTDIGVMQRGFIMYLLIIIGSFMLFKAIYVVFTAQEEITLRGNFIKNVIFVMRYGFNYKTTRRALIITILSILAFYGVYLYSLAVNGGYEHNLLSKFFLSYPFKGTFVLMLLPLIGIFYGLKKSLEIIKVKESIVNIGSSEEEYNIDFDDSRETRELVDNINALRGQYKVAVVDALKNEKLKTELISNVSHDLRTPLTSIINYINILKSDVSEKERAEYLEIVEKKSKKLKVLIDDLFEMSKINSGKMEIFKEDINIVSLLHQTIGEYYYLYENNEIDFKVESFKEEVILSLDGKLISRAFENIIINAMKYSLPKTRVYVEVLEEDKYVVISVKNISNYEMHFNNQEIFERFSRGDISRNSGIEGSGLGLAITKSIVEIHDGFVRVKKEGDMFKIYIYLPR